MQSQLFSPQHAEAQQGQPGMRLQNGKMLKLALNGEMLVRQGSMVGVGKFIKQHLTGEGVPLMKCAGVGNVFLGDLASDVHIIDLDGTHDSITINGRNVLAFEPSCPTTSNGCKAPG